jgi:hypothetical protein
MNATPDVLQQVTNEQLTTATWAYGQMKQNREMAEQFLAATERWNKTLIKDALDEMQRRLNQPKTEPMNLVAEESAPTVPDSPKDLTDDQWAQMVGDEPIAPVIEAFDPLPLVPQVLKALPNWVTYRTSPLDKKPIISGTTRNADSSDPTTWVDYQTACNNIQEGRGYTGLGFVCDGANSHNLVGFDFDGCRNPETGELTNWAKQIIALLGVTYGEVTISGTGLRFWFYVPSFKKNVKFRMSFTPLYEGKNQKLEIFGDGLYFTMSGNRLPNLSSEVVTLSESQMDSILSLAQSLTVEEKKLDKSAVSGYTTQKDEGFQKLFDVIGWKPMFDRMNKMSDSRFHDMTLNAGEMTYCPMPEHKPRGESMRYSPCFGALADEPAVVHCFGCDFTGDMVKAVFEFDAGEDGGRIQHKNMYDAARAICGENALNFEEFFPPQAASTLSLNQTAQIATSASGNVDADAVKKQAQDEYDALVEKCQQQEERVENPYPTEVWEGTPYLGFARVCRGMGRDESYIPDEYFINGMMTTVGAICGNRVVPKFNQNLQARFITLLLSTKGGIGKNSVMDWCKIPFVETGLIYQGDLNRKFNSIGCIVADFGSARGMVETMSRHPRILQEYAEFSTVVEKFSIAGSGDAFRDMTLNLADGQVPNWSIIKGTKVPSNAPKEISNSILAGTTDERFQEMMMKSNWETFMQRMNIVPTDETRTKFKLVLPNLEPMKEKLLPRIQMLESHKLVWALSPEAEAFGEKWFESLHEKAGDEDSESVGRIQVYLFRIISHLALWLAPLPTTVGVETTPNGGAIAIWNYEVPVEVMQKATRVAEWQVMARSANMPVRGSTTAGVVENVITKWVFKQQSIRWVELKRRSKIARFGYKACHDALTNLKASGVLVLKVDPNEPGEQRSWVVVWHGSTGTFKKWKETRGGKRRGAGRKPPKS